MENFKTESPIMADKVEEKREEKPRRKSRWFYRDTFEKDRDIQEKMARDVDFRAFMRDKL